jgi:hypothetical protein
VLKYYVTGSQLNSYNTTRAFEYAAEKKFDYINYSSGGVDPSEKERIAVERYLNHGGKLISAAGNEGKNLDMPGNQYYPAMYDKRIIVVGMLDVNGIQYEYSNYGKVVNRWEIGQELIGYGVKMSGTSQSTAVATGKIVSENPNKCKR